MLNHFVVLFLLAISGALNAAAEEDMFLDKPNHQASVTANRYHVKWLTDYIKFPVSFEKQCPAADQDQYVWRRRSDGLLIRANQKFGSYAVSTEDEKTKLTITQVHLDRPEELAIYEPVVESAATADLQADHHRDLFAFAYLKSHSILVNKTQDMINITCVADFMVPNGFNEDINDGFLAKMERNAIFKMTMNSLNSVKKEKNHQLEQQPIPVATLATPTTTGSMPLRVPFVQADAAEQAAASKDEFVKAQLKLLLQDLHKNHHPEKLSRDPSFAQTWSHIQRSSPPPRPRMPQSPPVDNSLISNQIFQAQQKVQDKLMMLQSGGATAAAAAPVTPGQQSNNGKQPFRETGPVNQMQMIPNMFPIRAHPMQAMPFMPFSMPMQMPMFAFMHKRKRFARQAADPSQSSPAEETLLEVPEVTGQVVSSNNGGDQSQMVPEPIQQIRLKYGPITLYRPLRQAEIITCNLKLVNQDDMKIDHQSTVFATVRRDTQADRKSNAIKTNPQYDVDDEAKWAKELNSITDTLKKKIQLGQDLREAPKAEAEAEATTTTASTAINGESKLDQLEAELQKPEFNPDSQNRRSQASALKKAGQPAMSSSSARFVSIDLALFLFPLLVFYFTSF